jgi:hypothetical protein
VRTYGRDSVTRQWAIVETNAQGFDDAVWITTLVQTLRLNLGESPFFANYGIPAHPSVVQQIFPDYYVAFTQQQYAPHFASLLVTKVPGPAPVYSISVTTEQGFQSNHEVSVGFSDDFTSEFA